MDVASGLRSGIRFGCAGALFVILLVVDAEDAFLRDPLPALALDEFADAAVPRAQGNQVEGHSLLHFVDNVSDKGGAMANPEVTLDARSAIALKTRYVDAYKIARTIIKLGSAIKLIGMILAGLIALGAIVSGFATAKSQGIVGAFGAPTGASVSAAAIALGVLTAVVIGLLFFIFGTFVSAQGEILLASLDSAVNSSPLLDNATKVHVLLGHSSSGMFSTSISH